MKQACIAVATVLLLTRPSIAGADEDEPERPMPRARFGAGAGLAFAACGKFCGAIHNPGYGFRAFSVWPVDDGLGLGFTADLGLFREDEGPIANGFFMGGLFEVSSGYRATSSFSFWLALGGFNGEQGMADCSPSGLALQGGLRGGTHLSDAMFASVAVSAAGSPFAGGCAQPSLLPLQARSERSPVQAMGTVTLELAYELGR